MQRKRACTTHVLRFGRHQSGDGTESLVPLCDLAIYRRPHTVLFKEVAELLPVRQLEPGSGEGQHTSTTRHDRHLHRSRSGRPINAEGSGLRAYVLKGVPRRSSSALQAHCSQADPRGVQFGVGLARSAPLLLEKLIEIERGVSC
jgi:hypothetical protein